MNLFIINYTAGKEGFASVNVIANNIEDAIKEFKDSSFAEKSSGIKNIDCDQSPVIVSGIKASLPNIISAKGKTP